MNLVIFTKITESGPTGFKVIVVDLPILAEQVCCCLINGKVEMASSPIESGLSFPPKDTDRSNTCGPYLIPI